MAAVRWPTWCWTLGAGLVLALPAASACQGPGGGDGGRPPPVGHGGRVLMVGNSLTAGNALSEMVEALADSAGLAWEVEAVTISGASLEDHWLAGTAAERIRRGGWQAVVLQQGPSAQPESRTNLRHWAAEFDALVREAGGRTALYMVWPFSSRPGDFDRVRDSYALAAADVGGRFLPAGEAWRAAWRRDGDAPLYGPDGFHPTAEGSYAAALAIVAGLSDRSPLDLPATLARANGDILVRVPPSLAQLLRSAAAEAAAAYRDYRPADLP